MLLGASVRDDRGAAGFCLPLVAWVIRGVDGAAFMAGAGGGGARAVRAKHSGREAALPVAVRDRFGELFANAEFAEAFGTTGSRGWSPGRLALVTAFQVAENLTDRQAAEAVRDRLSWAYALGLDLTDTGFDHTVLS
jgi:hypothetical protein